MTTERQPRQVQVARRTAETDIGLQLNLDGVGRADIQTGVGFFDHMLTLMAAHGLLDLAISAGGDTHIDDHHTVEDVGIVLGQAIGQALGDKAGIRRYGHATVPMDEALALVAIDCSGRGLLAYDAEFKRDKIGTFDTELVEEFLRAMAHNAGVTLHVRLLAGHNAHHIAEAIFKALGQALRAAVEPDPRREGIPSTKGTLRNTHASRIPHPASRILHPASRIPHPAPRIAIIDYGMGNLRSVQKAFEHIGAQASITADAGVIEQAPAIVLPGVGAFGDAVRNLREAGLDMAIHRAVEAGKPFLGICLGQQLMFETSEEMGEHQGLGLFRGHVRRFPDGTLKVPHIGWNQMHIQREDPLLAGIASESFAYFVHSYFVEPEDDGLIVATTDYGIDFASIVGRDQVWGIQFHPEKSQDVGLRILENFVGIVEQGVKGTQGNLEELGGTQGDVRNSGELG